MASGPLASVPRSRRLRLWLSLAALLFWALACGAQVEGQLVWSGEPHGDFTLNLTRCASGEHRQFFGVVLAPDDLAGGVKIVSDSVSGDLVQLEVPGTCDPDGEGCARVDFGREDCSVFDVVVEQGKNRVNLFWEVNGSLDMKCTSDASSIEAHVQFRGCS